MCLEEKNERFKKWEDRPKKTSPHPQPGHRRSPRLGVEIEGAATSGSAAGLGWVVETEEPGK